MHRVVRTTPAKKPRTECCCQPVDDKGLLGTTLRYPYEVRNATDYFADLPELIAPDMRKLAERILDSKAGNFDPTAFRDRYEEALLAHLKARQAGAVQAPKPTFAAPRRVTNLMEASPRTKNNCRPARSLRSSRCTRGGT